MRFVVLSLCVCVLAACQAAPAPGATCERAADCAAPLSCHFGRCRAQCSANRDCGAGATCVLDASGVGSCTLETDLGCESGVGRECASGLLCVADHCLQACGPATGCATGSVCTPTGAGESFCAPSDLDAGTGAILDAALDAGPTDAGPGSMVGTACIGDGFVCATRASDRTVWCWGESVAYSLGASPGDPGTGCLSPPGRDTATPLQVPTLADVDQLVCGASWACAHSANGTVSCWGESYGGVLDPGHAMCDRTPHAIVGVGGTVELASSLQLACAADRTAGTLTCWGSDQGTVYPQDPPPSPTTFMLPTSTTALAIAASAQPEYVGIDDGMPHADDSYGGGCYVETAGGAVWCWGTNLGGQRGTPSTTRVLTTAAPVPGLPGGATALAHGDSSNCVLVGAGDLWCWGIGNVGQLAQVPTTLGESCMTMDATYACSSSPLAYTRFTFSRIASHGSSGATCGIALAGSGILAGQVFCWGSGEFGANTRMDHSPVDDPLSGRVVRADDSMPLDAAHDVFVAFRNACAVDLFGALWCWGDNASQQLQLQSSTPASAQAVRLTIP